MRSFLGGVFWVVGDLVMNRVAVMRFVLPVCFSDVTLSDRNCQLFGIRVHVQDGFSDESVAGGRVGRWFVGGFVQSWCVMSFSV